MFPGLVQFSYIFPPFRRDKAHCLAIISKWTTQYWYPVIMEMAIGEIKIKPAPDNLLLPQDKKKLHKNLTLAAVLIQWK